VFVSFVQTSDSESPQSGSQYSDSGVDAEVARKTDLILNHARELLEYIQRLSVHVIRKKVSDGKGGSCISEVFDPTLPAQLVSSWQPEEYRFKRPPCLVWVEDDATAEARSIRSELPKHMKEEFPVVPMWLISVPGDGNCTIASLLGSNLNDPVTKELTELSERWHKLERGMTYLEVLSNQREEESRILADYRKK
jgi:hypothetical protein